MASSVFRSAGNGNSNTGTTFLYHGTGNSKFSRTCGTMPPINFRVNIESLLLSNKWWASNIRHNRNSFHLTWESTFATISAWTLTAWPVFPRSACVTIRRNLIGLLLLRVVNNSDSWIRKAWEWREASHVVRTRFVTRLSAIDYAAVRTAQQLRRAESITLITSLPIYDPSRRRMYWELRCCGGKSHILTIQHRI